MCPVNSVSHFSSIHVDVTKFEHLSNCSARNGKISSDRRVKNRVSVVGMFLLHLQSAIKAEIPQCWGKIKT